MSTQLLLRSAIRCVNLQSSARIATTSLRFRAFKVDVDIYDAPKLKNELEIMKPEEAAYKKRKEGAYITVEGISNISPVSGIPKEHIRERRVRIFQPAKNPMQSGTNCLDTWQLEFDTRERWENPLMGWCSSGDPMSNMNVKFGSKEEAIAYCAKYGYPWFIQERTIKPVKIKSYVEIYSWNRRTRSSTK